MKLYSYYSDVPVIGAFDSLKLIALWRQHWTAAGWEPFVLNEWHARQHPRYAEFHSKLCVLPSVNPKEYEIACYLRWLALAQVGGGWMADYDVFETKAPGAPPHWHELTGAELGKIQIFQTPCCPCLVWCSADNAVQFLEQASTGQYGRREINGSAHYSDQYALEDLHMARVPWIEIRDMVKLWSDKGWETAPVVHYANAVCQPQGKTPRWQHIPGLLKP